MINEKAAREYATSKAAARETMDHNLLEREYPKLGVCPCCKEV